jgi:hypothetical protein
MDVVTVKKVYTGKVISVAGVNVNPVGVKAGMSARDNFLHDFLNQDEEKYTAYWTVRRFIGKGAPPAELTSAAEVIRYVQVTPGAVGYIDETALKPGMNVVTRTRTAGLFDNLPELETFLTPINDFVQAPQKLSMEAEVLIVSADNYVR